MPLSGSLALSEPVTERILRATQDALARGRALEATAVAEHAIAAGLSPADDAIDASADRARLLVYGPAAHANRYQGLLYSRAGDFDLGLVPLKNFDELDELPLFGRFVLHLHWLGGLTASPEEAIAREKSEAFIETLDALRRERDVRVVWTAHNLLPHDAPHPDLDRAFRQQLIDRCDAIHCMTDASVERLRENFALGDTHVFVVPHPSYEGAYPDYVSRAAARALIGIPQSARVVLSFGAIQRYKGYAELRLAFERLRETEEGADALLLIAGAPASVIDLAEITAWARQRSDVKLMAEKIADDDLQLVFKASDVAVCPYHETMNSGVAALALTFGVPVVAPDRGAFTALSGMGAAIYDPGNGSAACADAIRAVLSEPDRWRREIDGFLEAHAPPRVSRAFLERIETLWL